MRTKLFTLFVFSLLGVLPLKAISSFKSFQVEDKRDIDLEGDVEDDNKKSLVVPFNAYQVDNTEICVMSLGTYSSVTISIIDISGVTIDVLSLPLRPQQIVSIDISGYFKGAYSLIISTPQGIYLTGRFEIN